MALDMPRVEITQIPNKVGMNIKDPKTNISKQDSKVEVSQQPGDMQINEDMVKVNVDNYPARYDLGYKNYKDFSKENAQKGKQAFLSQTAKYARQGDQLMKIENGGKPLISQAKAENKPENKEVTLGWKRGPKFNVKKGNLEINYNPNKPDVNAQKGSVTSELEWGKVSTFLRQKQKFGIELRGSNINRLT